MHLYLQVTGLVIPTGSTVSPSKVSASYISFELVQCAISKMVPHYIAVSNDGTSTSTAKGIYVPYDSRCYDCAINDQFQATCTRKQVRPFILTTTDLRCFVELLGHKLRANRNSLRIDTFIFS